jgi:hypothetical protein
VSTEAEIQRRFAGFLRRRRDLGKDDEALRFADELVAGNERLSPVEQLEIYREQFWLRHTASLVEDFPGVGGILEQERWDRLIWEYLEQEAEYSYSLRDLGARLPDFTARQSWLEERELVTDMARFEWAHVEVFDAPDVPRLDPEELAAVPEGAWESARLLLDPALRLLRLGHPVAELRRRLIALQNDASLPKPAWPAKAETRIALHRRERVICMDSLESAAFALLAAFAAGAPLGSACEEAARASGVEVEVLGERLESWFTEWAARGYVVGVMVLP